MYLHFNLRNIKCLKQSDKLLDKESEFFHTYRVYIGSADQDVQLTQGFSLGAPIDDGYALEEGQQKTVNDPRFTVQLPDVDDGATMRVVLDLFAWESDSANTEEIKKLFTNEASAKLMEIYKAQDKKKKKTYEKFMDWVQDGDNEVLGALITTGIVASSVVTPYVAVAKAATSILGWALEAARTDGDDPLPYARMEVLIARTDGKLRYRWIFNNGAETWFEEERPWIRGAWRAEEANNDNILDHTYGIQIVEASPDEFQ
ncbi:MAG: hypothetical protein OXT09_05200 [Myxococcales bacterium]|nr:hypothetical protein [Myxococcales bacterium]